MPKIDTSNVPPRTSSAYPAPYDSHCRGREKTALGDPGGLAQFGVNLTRLKPGAASAHRHWHKNEDEFVYMLEGEAVLVEDNGETVLRPGDAAAFKAGVAVGHMIVNRSDKDAVFLEVGTRSADEAVTYTDPDIDMRAVKENGVVRIMRRNGDPF
jgi:uncharacterized cupin superfamily protein